MVVYDRQNWCRDEQQHIDKGEPYPVLDDLSRVRHVPIDDTSEDVQVGHDDDGHH